MKRYQEEMLIMSPINVPSYFCYLIIFTVLIVLWIQDMGKAAQSEKIKEFISQCVHHLHLLNEKKYSEPKVVLIDHKCYQGKLADEMQKYNIELRRFNIHQLKEIHLDDVQAVILDMNSAGLHCARQLREFSEDIPIYGLSNQEEWNELLEALDAGMNGTVSFPLSAEMFMEILERAI